MDIKKVEEGEQRNEVTGGGGSGKGSLSQSQVEYSLSGFTKRSDMGIKE